jgi:NDP-sugar pyrophosphorylase family protein/anti-anti-sigma regulatory factor
MLIHTEHVDDGLAILRVSGRLQHASGLHVLLDACARQLSEGRHGFVIDLSKSHAVSYAGIAALVELAARLSRATIVYSGMGVRLRRRLASSGLDRGLRIYGTVPEALNATELQELRLCKTRAVLLDQSPGGAKSCTTDILGAPALCRVTDQLGQFGLCRFIVNLEDRSAIYPEFLAANPRLEEKLLLSLQETDPCQDNQPRGLGSAATLKALQYRHSCFSSDVIVQGASVLTDLNLADMMQRHRQTNADVTIAIPRSRKTGAAASETVNADPTGRVTCLSTWPGDAAAGVYILKPWVIDLIPDTRSATIEDDLLPSLLAEHCNIRVYEADFAHFDTRTWPDRFSASKWLLSSGQEHLRPAGKEISAGIWAAQSAQIARGARIDGPCFLGRNAQIAKGAHLLGTNVIGAGAHVSGKAVLRDCLVSRDVWIRSGSWGECTVFQPDHAFDYRFPATENQNTALPGNIAHSKHPASERFKRRA